MFFFTFFVLLCAQMFHHCKCHYLIVVRAVCGFLHWCVLLLLSNFHTNHRVHVQTDQLTGLDYCNADLQDIIIQLNNTADKTYTELQWASYTLTKTDEAAFIWGWNLLCIYYYRGQISQVCFGDLNDKWATAYPTGSQIHKVNIQGHIWTNNQAKLSQWKENHNTFHNFSS